MITGRSERVRIERSRSNPLVPGSLTSSSMSAGSIRGSASRSRSPSSASVTPIAGVLEIAAQNRPHHGVVVYDHDPPGGSFVRPGR